MFNRKKGNTFDRIAERFRVSIRELEEVELKDADQIEQNDDTIGRLVKTNQELTDEKRRCSRMRARLQDLVGDE